MYLYIADMDKVYRLEQDIRSRATFLYIFWLFVKKNQWKNLFTSLSNEELSLSKFFYMSIYISTLRAFLAAHHIYCQVLFWSFHSCLHLCGTSSSLFGMGGRSIEVPFPPPLSLRRYLDLIVLNNVCNSFRVIVKTLYQQLLPSFQYG